MNTIQLCQEQLNIYHCFTCERKGYGALNFYHAITRGDGPSQDLILSARELMSMFFSGQGEVLPYKVPLRNPITEKPKTNPVKKIALSTDPEVPYLRETKNLSPETLAHFKVGLTDFGSLKGRIAVPIDNAKGRRIGYAGQDPEKGDWLFYINKSLELYNYHRAKSLLENKGEKLEEVFVVESFYGAMYLHQEGFPNTVALMGRFLSYEQLQLLQELSSHCTFFLDGDMAGKKALTLLEETLNKNATEEMTYKIIRFPEGSSRIKPNQFTGEELEKVLGVKKTGGE